MVELPIIERSIFFGALILYLGSAVVEGRLDISGVFQADRLMTKCESKYKAKVK